MQLENGQITIPNTSCGNRIIPNTAAVATASLQTQQQWRPHHSKYSSSGDRITPNTAAAANTFTGPWTVPFWEKQSYTSASEYTFQRPAHVTSCGTDRVVDPHGPHNRHHGSRRVVSSQPSVE
jgi:hypothetical protein